MNLPENGASMGDAANTREDEKPSICDDCDQDPLTCNGTHGACLEAMETEIADNTVKARKEGL